MQMLHQSNLNGVEAAVLPGEFQQRHQCLQQEGGSACLQNETSLGDKHATLTVETRKELVTNNHRASFSSLYSMIHNDD